MKIDCLMGTYGRYGLACEALACFLQQTKLADATLLIYNQHPIPLRFEHPRVRIVNEKLEPTPLRHIRRRMLDLADPTADLIHFIEDDDLYLPWHLESCAAHIGDHVAWKPLASWMSVDNAAFSLERNYFEGSCIYRADFIQSAPLDTHPDYIDHPAFMDALHSGRLATTDLGGRTSYIYRWGGGTHLSAYGGSATGEQQRQYAIAWRERSTDFRLGGRMVPADLTQRWREYLEGTRQLVTPEEWELNRKGVGL